MLFITDHVPGDDLGQAHFEESERARLKDFECRDTIIRPLPPLTHYRRWARAIEPALRTEMSAAVRRAGLALTDRLADHFFVRRPKLRVRGARPRETVGREAIEELHGYYHPRTASIHLWMRTAVREQVASWDAILHVLCHEFCHHLDHQYLPFARLYGSLHTRGFYERTARLYHAISGRLELPRFSCSAWRTTTFPPTST